LAEMAPCKCHRSVLTDHQMYKVRARVVRGLQPVPLHLVTVSLAKVDTQDLLVDRRLHRLGTTTLARLPCARACRSTITF
jgi:hypothetical protein